MWQVSAKSKEKKPAPEKMLPRDFPIYGNDTVKPHHEYVELPPSLLTASLGTARRTVMDQASQYRPMFDRAEHICLTGIAHTTSFIEQLQHQENVVARGSAVTAGGLSGLTLAALRSRGLFMRLAYTATGLLVPLAICYPQQRSDYLQFCYQEAVKYYAVAYNFILGVKPGSSAPANTDSSSQVSQSDRDRS